MTDTLQPTLAVGAYRTLYLSDIYLREGSLFKALFIDIHSISTLFSIA